MQKESVFRLNIDIAWGLLSWAVALCMFHLYSMHNIDFQLLYGLVIIPTIWAICVAKAMKRRKRKLVYLLWIWLSAPAALYAWFFAIVMMESTKNYRP